MVPALKLFLRSAGLVLTILAAVALSTEAQVKKYPADVIPIVGPPYSLFLNDYSTPGTNLLTANIVFNDFNEPSWNFRLRIKIESQNVRLETRQDFRPSAPITLSPGVLRSLSGTDWEDYLNYNNLVISGTSVNQLVSSGGRLPEGFYSFCFQVLDYDTGDPLSAEICRTAWLKLMDPPRLNLPACGISLSPNQTQYPFTWQLFDAVSPNATEGTRYQLTIWEITDRMASIQTAVANGQALQIFQSDELMDPTYAYSLADPPLELGKQYVYRVRAIDPEGKDKFKNQGNSEFCSFYYGWPVNGRIQLRSPAAGGGFRKKDIPTVSWSPVDTQLPGQMVSYEITIAPVIGGQTPEQAIQSNEPWFHFITPPNPNRTERAHQVEQKLEVLTRYAWQVKAFTDQIEVGASSVSYFNGPALMEEFWASIHRVEVDYLDGSNLDDISGGGRIRLEHNANAWVPVTFHHIKLASRGTFYVMTGGEFFADVNKSVELTPLLADNGAAFFDITRFRVDKDGIYAYGSVRWPLPFPTLSGNLAFMRSESQWSNYNAHAVNTAARVASGNSFRLLDPLQFTMNLSTAGAIYISDNVYSLDLSGEVELPAKVKGILPGVVKLPFNKARNLHYLEQDSLMAPALAPLNKAGLEVRPVRYTIDLSDMRSPGQHQGNAFWKGVYFNDFELKLQTSLDGHGQFQLTTEHKEEYLQDASENLEAWASTQGLTFRQTIDFADSTLMTFQTFTSMARTLAIHVKDGDIVQEDSYLKGSIVVPVVSTQKSFGFTVPVNTMGFQDGYLDDLTDTRFVFNEGAGDQEIRMAITRAVFAGYERIDMSLDIEWPSLGLSLTSLPEFRAWGDNSIGFGTKNGTIPLSQRYNVSLGGYPITVAVIGSGSNNGTYVFATTADAVLGDDVSGSGGVPSINVYSVMANSYVPKDASGTVQAPTSQTISFDQASQSVTQNFDNLQKDLSAKMEADQEAIVAAAEDLKESLASSPSALFTADEIVGADNTPGEANGEIPGMTTSKFNNRQQEIIYDIAAGFVDELTKAALRPLKSRTDSLTIKLNRKVDSLIAKAEYQVRQKLTIVVNEVATKLIGALENKEIDVETPINQMAAATIDRITDEIISSLRQSTKNNLIDPLNVLLRDKVYGRVNKYIVDHGTEAFYSALTGDTQASGEQMKAMGDGIPQLIEDIIKDVVAFVSIDNIRSTIEGTANDFVNNINVSEVAHDLRISAEKVLNEAIRKEASEALSGLATKYAPELGLGEMGVPSSAPINFIGVAERLAAGDLKGAFAIDPVPVKLRTPMVDLDGFIKYTPKHPVYGDVWLGDIDMFFKAPKRFSFNAIYFNGRKEDLPYWFCQITPPEGSNKPYDLGKPLAKKAKALPDPVDIGAARIMGASGRMYHHMKETPGGGIVPEGGMRYGAFMHFVFYDKASEGANLRLEVMGEINTQENGDYTIAFDGNLQMQNKKVEVFEPDPAAAIKGTISIRYNSAEEHFLGYAAVIVQRKDLCATASLLVDVRPGAWRVAIGSREQRVTFVPGCAGWSPTGWLDLNQSEAELGLGIMYTIRAETPNVNIGLAKFNFVLDAGAAFGILALVQYRPTFALMKAGVWIDIWATIVANYKLVASDWKSVTLVEIFIRGDLVMIFNPPPTVLEGRLNGRVSLLCFNVNFEANMRKVL